MHIRDEDWPDETKTLRISLPEHVKQRLQVQAQLVERRSMSAIVTDALTQWLRGQDDLPPVRTDRGRDDQREAQETRGQG